MQQSLLMQQCVERMATLRQLTRRLAAARAR
jgi:hypothetical protein